MSAHALFPPFVAFTELSADAAPDPLFPEEEAAIARAVEKRRREFALGRSCARRALASIGITPAALPANPDRSVQWPDAAFGSITHTDGYYAAVAALREHVHGIGIDAEVRARVEPRLWSHIASEREIAWFKQASGEREANERATLLFSAKEAFYKAQYCVSQTFVGFHEVELFFDEPDAFTVEFQVDVASAFKRGQRFHGRYQLLPRHVLTRVILQR